MASYKTTFTFELLLTDPVNSQDYTHSVSNRWKDEWARKKGLLLTGKAEVLHE